MANWPDAMRVISDETQDLIDAVYDLDCPTIGPFVTGVDSPDDMGTGTVLFPGYTCLTLP
jgi:hypothetical protein